jgi:hypothetical protein
MGMPTRVEMISCQADLRSTLRQLDRSTVIEIVAAPKATRGVAVSTSIIIASKGIAIRASPKPRAERMRVAKKRTAMTSVVDTAGSIESP